MCYFETQEGSISFSQYYLPCHIFLFLFFTDSNKLSEDMLPFIVGHCGEYMLPTSLSNVFHFPQQNKVPKRQEGEIGFSREKPVGLFKSLVRAYGFEDCWILDLCSGAGTTPI